MSRPLIALVTEDDPRDKRSWSGTNHFLWKALLNHVGEVELLGPFTPQPLRFICSAFNFLTLRLFGKRFDYRHSNLMRKAYGKYFTRRLAGKKYDFVLVSASISSAAGIKTSAPIVYINDRVIAGAMNYHKVLTQLFAFSKRQSLQNDKTAIVNSTVSVFCSDWAASAAKEIHGFSSDKVKMIPFGANLEIAPAVPVDVDFPAEVIRLLFVGVNWEDKGGATAYDSLMSLINSGINAELHVVGCTPPDEFNHNKVKVHGFLNKNVAADFVKLTELFRTSHFFVLPTKYEAYGLVFCEAAAYGVPALAPATGGITTIIDDNITGFLFPPSAKGDDYAAKIRTLIANPSQWQEMRKAAHERFKTKLNWDAWGESMKAVLREKRIIP